MFSRTLDTAAEFVRGVEGSGFPFAKATILTGFGLIGCWQEFANSIRCYWNPNAPRYPWRKTIEQLWKVPPGFRQLAWDERKSEHRQSHSEAVEGARVAFRMTAAIRPWYLAWQ